MNQGIWIMIRWYLENTEDFLLFYAIKVAPETELAKSSSQSLCVHLFPNLSHVQPTSIARDGSLLWTCVVSLVRSSGTFDAYDPTQDPERCGPTECNWLAKPDGLYVWVASAHEYVKKFLWPS
ncbi:Plant self-incompatibility S1 [Dillenia turbinata]|uniref:Plant self-incompatibility S1 n=1 Tax=Dillenia turbinata TaxID=194707 RepID=A0AAN8VL72_9MAGN